MPSITSLWQRRAIEQESHINALWLAKTQAKYHRGQDRLSLASVHIPTLLQQSLNAGMCSRPPSAYSMSISISMAGMNLNIAVGEALKQQSPYPQAVQQILERRRDEKQKPPPLAVAVPEKVKHLGVKTGNVAEYDTLYRTEQGEDHE